MASEGVYKNNIRYKFPNGAVWKCESKPCMQLVIDDDGNVKNEAYIRYVWVMAYD